MRTLRKRKPLLKRVADKLDSETLAIISAKDQKSEAHRRYSNARKAKWFESVVKELGELAGPGERCMFCSGSEASDVEHYKPKSVFPQLAMTWENYLWSCTPCNRGKLDRFPPDTGPGGRLINPLDENVWDFFFIDDFGLLTPRYDRQANTLNPRAVTTRDMLSLNRDALQISRKQRIENLKRDVYNCLKLMNLKKLTKKAASEQVEIWKAESWQPDVADFYLNGPGRKSSPFREFFEAITV